MNNGGNSVNQKDEPDLIAEGFHKLDQAAVLRNPPKIKWGQTYRGWPDARKISYLEAFGSSMNHAAYLLQKERNELDRLCALKEKQITQMSQAIEANNVMLQSEVTKMNAERQGFNSAVTKLNQKIRDLKRSTV